MHELSVALSLVQAADRAAKRAGAERVNFLRVRIGTMAGVVPEALQFGYEVATRGTLLEGSALRIETVPVAVYCAECDEEREMPALHGFRCPVCRSTAARIVRGKELEVLDMEVEP